MSRIVATTCLISIATVLLVSTERSTAHAAIQVPRTTANQVIAYATGDAPIFIRPNATTPLRVLPLGTRLEVIEEREGWTQIEFQDPQWGPRIGWVNSELIVIRRPTVADAVPSDVTKRDEDNSPQLLSATPRRVPSVDPSPVDPPTQKPRDTSRGVVSDRASSGPSTRTQRVKIHGYVTSMSSPTHFEIEDYRITSNDSLSLDFENAGPDVTFTARDVRVGLEVELSGELDEATGELNASSMKVDLDQFRLKPLTAIIAEAPTGIALGPNGWTGDFVADGQRIHISTTTRVLFRLSKSDKDLQKQAKRHAPHEAIDANDVDSEVLHSLDQVAAGMSLTYQGRRDPLTGIVQADRVTFARNDLEAGEARLWKSLKVSERSAQGLRPAVLTINRVGKFTLLASDEVQRYVTRIGSSMVPAYQRDLPTSDPAKIPFQWHVVIDKEANAFALANGTVVLNSGLLDVLENEAQLAAVIAHEMAHATQEHTWRQQQFHKTERAGLQIAAAIASAYGKYNLSSLLTMTEAAIRNGYSRNLENQADRIGMGYMTAAGYDPREAPRVWKVMTAKYGLHGTNFFWSSHDNAAMRRSYLMNELRQNYQAVDFGSLKHNTEDFARMQASAREATIRKPKVKVR
jgi:Zn-dependent protease with chaperone function